MKNDACPDDHRDGRCSHCGITFDLRTTWATPDWAVAAATKVAADRAACAGGN